MNQYKPTKSVRHYASVAVLYSSAGIILRVFAFFFTIWLVKELTPDEYGQWSLLYSYQTGISTFTAAGFFEASVGLMKYQANTTNRESLFNEIRKIYYSTLLITVLVLSLGLWVSSPSTNVLLLVSVLAYGGLTGLTRLESQLSQIKEDHCLSLFYLFFLPLFAMVVSALAFLLLKTPNSYFYGAAAAYTISLSYIVSRFFIQHYSIPLKTNIIRILARVLPFTVIAFFGWFSGYGINIALFRIFDNFVVARYTFVLSIGSLLLLVVSGMNQVWTPRFYNTVFNEVPQAVEEKNRLFYRFQCILVALISTILILTLPLILTSSGGNLAKYADNNIGFFFIFSSYVLLVPWWHSSNYFLVHDLGSLLMRISIITSLVGFAIWFWLMLAFGEFGAYLGFFTLNAIRSVSIVFVARRYWPVRVDSFGLTFAISLPLLAALTVYNYY